MLVQVDVIKYILGFNCVISHSGRELLRLLIVLLT